MAYKDYYKIMGLKKDATKADVKKAFRKLARKHHPDLNKGDKKSEEKFKELNEANEVLSNVENRKKYDKHGENWKHADEIEKQAKERAKHQNQYSRSGGSSAYSNQDYSSFFEDMFGGQTGGARAGGRGNVKFKGQDFNAELQLDLTDVYETHKRTLTVNGKNIRLTIPAGVENGQTIKIKGHGGEGVNGGPKGDLLIQFNIQNNSKFKREKNNLSLNLELDLYTALLGGELEVPVFDGKKVKLKVKPETQSGTKVKLKGKGFPVYKKADQFGDLFITYQIKLPTNLNEKEIQLIKELAKLR